MAASQRLSTITEAGNAGASGGQQPRGILRTSSSNPATPRRPGTPRQLSGGARAASQDTTRTGPPAYNWVPEPVGVDEEDLTAPVEGEKLAQLRRDGGHVRRKRDRGGWGRIALIAGLLLVIIALAVGLGVGLTWKKHQDGNGNSSSGQSSQPAGTTPSNGQEQQFPLGEYSYITALRSVKTNCTSNPATWSCYPYSVFNPSDSSSNTSSLASFNWVVSNTSSMYATNSTTATSDQVMQSNLTISSTSNPFSIMFTNEPLTYINSRSNSSSARYTFSFEMSKAVIPSASITSNNAAAECFFNQTIFTGTLYLEAARTYPSADLADSTGLGGYTPWPFAIEITQSSPGGQNVPTCYEMVNGNVGDRILTAVTPEPESDECSCDYRNY
ncbi:hypothetical protein LTR85_011685 [Meristemomyces frigidus]|nr:hypothetical protein LTR85_011685 [Meristemomyces frigidus]